MEDDPIVFATKEDLISAVEEYASSHGFQVVRQRNEEDRITFCCSRGKQRRSKVSSSDSTSEDPFTRKRRKSYVEVLVGYYYISKKKIIFRHINFLSKHIYT